jgi:hypothetical protein
MPIDKFWKNNGSVDGFYQSCKECHNSFYGVNTDESRTKRRAARPPRWLSIAVSAAKTRAKRDGIMFSLEVSDIALPTHCPVLGIPLVLGHEKKKDDSPSLDRVIPHLGYTPGNVIVISWLANRLKADVTDPSVFDAISAYLRNHSQTDPLSHGTTSS